jgi:hypothetical protein
MPDHYDDGGLSGASLERAMLLAPEGGYLPNSAATKKPSKVSNACSVAQGRPLV